MTLDSIVRQRLGQLAAVRVRHYERANDGRLSEVDREVSSQMEQQAMSATAILCRNNGLTVSWPGLLPLVQHPDGREEQIGAGDE